MLARFCNARFGKIGGVFCILTLAVLLSYANSLTGVFQFDDYNVIVNYSTVHSWSAWYADLGRGLRPLLKLSYTLNWVSGMDVLGFHLLNIGVHIGTCLLVYFITLRLFINQPGETRSHTVALLTALLFAVHPANTEAVTYISGRSMSLMTLFYLAALLAYIKGVERQKSLWLYAISPLLFVLAVAAKETAITLPFALLLWEICFPDKNWNKNILQRQIVHWCLFLLLAALLLFNEKYWQLMQFSAELHSVKENFLTQLHAMSYLLGQTFLPWQLNIDPDLPIISTWSQAGWDVVIWFALLGVAIISLARQPYLSFALGWFVLQLLPLYIFLPRSDVVNDRHLYLVGWVMLLPVAALCAKMMANTKIRYAVPALLLALAGLTIARNQIYRSEVALWEDTVRSSPNKARAHNNLGYAYFLAGKLSQAEQAYLTALKLKPDYSRAEYNLSALRSGAVIFSEPGK